MKILLIFLFALSLGLACADVNEVYYLLVNDDPFPTDVPWKSLDTADIDGDGLIDVVLGRTDGLVQIWEQTAPGATTFQVAVDSFVTTPIYRVPVFVSICYFDADSLLDIITRKYVYLEDNFSHYEQSESDPYSFSFIHFGFDTEDGDGLGYNGTFYDVDDDGLVDYLSGGVYGVIHYEQTPDDCYTFTRCNSIYEFSYEVCTVQTIGVGNVDDDDQLDCLVSVYYNYPPVWYELNETHTQFTWNYLYFDSLQIDDAFEMNYELLDYDNDGDGDLFIIQESGVSLYENQLLQSVDKDEKEPVVSLSLSPNPVTTSCRIAYSLPQSHAASLAIYNIKGQQVRTFENLPGNEGQVTWDMRAQDGRPVAAGVYLCCLRAGNEAVTRKLLLLK